MEDNVFSEGDGSEEVQKSGTGEDGDRAEDKTPSQPSSSTKVSNNRATFSAFLLCGQQSRLHRLQSQHCGWSLEAGVFGIGEVRSEASAAVLSQWHNRGEWYQATVSFVWF